MPLSFSNRATQSLASLVSFMLALAARLRFTERNCCYQLPTLKLRPCIHGLLKLWWRRRDGHRRVGSHIHTRTGFLSGREPTIGWGARGRLDVGGKSCCFRLFRLRLVLLVRGRLDVGGKSFCFPLFRLRLVLLVNIEICGVWCWTPNGLGPNQPFSLAGAP